MCFVLLVRPSLVAIDFAADESVFMFIVTLSAVPTSCRRPCRWSPSLAHVPSAYSSASALLSATVACVLDKVTIVIPSSLITTPAVDFLVVWQPAQSLST